MLQPSKLGVGWQGLQNKNTELRGLFWHYSSGHRCVLTSARFLVFYSCGGVLAPERRP